MFTVRDPVSRFVSAFNGRLREDRPRYHYPWRDDERVAFAVFKTPDQLASALSSTDDAERAGAERAMHGIGHVNTPYATWFGDVPSFRGRLSDVYFIAFQEQLDDDFELLKEKLGLPPHVCLPSDPVAAHRSTALREGELRDFARANLRRWYAADVAFVDYCRELAPLVNPAEVPRRRGSVGPSVPQRTTAPAAAPLAERRLGPLGWGARVAITALAGVAAFAAAAGLVETFSDRDWSLSGFEWPADFATAMGIMALVPLVLNALSASTRTGRRGSTDSRVRDRVA